VSTSAPSNNEKHLGATLTVKSFSYLKDMELKPAYQLWTKHRQGGMGWATESDVHGIVKDALQDAIFAAGMKDKLKCLNELSVFELRADIWVVTMQSVPVGVVEVKKPGNDIMDSPLLHGQIYDYMLRLQSFFGLRHVFGIVSTYAQWRVCWLPGVSESVAASDAILSMDSARNEVGEDEGKDDGKDAVESDSDEVEFELLAANSRQLCGTRVYSWDDAELPRLLCSVLMKMEQSPKGSVKLFDNNRPYILVDESMWSWGTIKW
jgi:hypothetical protein